jgi:amino-acid N-acetyltransferase
MEVPRVTLRPADQEALSYVEARLEADELPTADVRAKPECFYVGYEGDTRVGVGGVESYGTDGLVRSVVVEPTARGQGIGMALCDALEAAAAERGVGTLYLLTTTAAGFFAKRGYVAVERDEVPDAIRGTTQFADLCPATATCMMRPL